MKVHLLPADDSACRLYRLIGPARAAQALGVETHVAPPVSYRASPMEGELPVSVDAAGADVVVIHRPVFTGIVELIPRLQAQGIAVVVDVDDDLSAPHPEHAWARPRPYVKPDEQARACRLADLVTVATPALGRVYAQHGRVALLRNCISAEMLALPRASDGRTVGWAGVAGGHPGDLPITRGGVAVALEREDWRFRTVGPPQRVGEQLGLGAAEGTGSLSLEAYHEALGTLDIGIVPLAQSPFNIAKSYLKGLEYAARGVAFVASSTPEYRRLANQGVGLIAREGARSWSGRLRDLMRDESLYAEQVECGRTVLAERHTYESQGGYWVAAWEQAIVNRKRSRR